VEGAKTHSQALSSGLLTFILILWVLLLGPSAGWAGVKVPGLELLHVRPLEDVSFYARAGHFPDAFLAFSPDEKHLAVGTFLGRLLLLEVESGRVLWEKRFPEAMVKRLAFSRDGEVLYAAEQSPDGYVYALRKDTGAELWRFRLADDLRPGEPPEKGDVFGIYKQPGCYRLEVLPDGDLLVLGIHSWFDRKAGSWLRLSRVWRLRPSGEVRWAWPADGPALLTLIYADADERGRFLGLVSTVPSDEMPRDYPLRPGTFYLLSAESGREIWRYEIPPLKPHFDRVFVWESVSLSPDGRLALVGTSDGRAIFFDLEARRVAHVLSLGAPLNIGGIPVSAHVSYGLFAPDGAAYVVTGPSSIPYGMPLAVNRPAGPHPQANMLFAIAPPRRIKWRFGMDFRFQGLATDAHGSWLAVAAGASRRSLEKRHQFGVFVFDAREGSLHAYYPTEGPCFFHLALSASGKHLAVVETPYLSEEEVLRGRYRLHVLRLAPEATR